MKKTLLALAVVAASGAAFAQTATLSGSYLFGYQSNKIAGVTSAGIGTDTAAIALVATEDLGGGLKATAKVSLGGMMRDGAGTGEDAFVSLSGGFGTLMMGTVETDDGLARARAGIPGLGLDGRVHSANPPIDVLGYTSPQLAPGVTVGYSYVDRGATGTSGLAAGTTGPAAAQPSHTGNIAYKAGPIDARFDVTSWTRQGAADVTSNKNKNRFRVSGNYNFGVASLGLGYSSVKTTVSTTVKETIVGLWAPVGAAEVGLQYEVFDNAGVKTKGNSLGAKYNLSKRTAAHVSMANWKKDGSESNRAFFLGLGHSF
jgi:Gram-negative porin